MSRERDAAATAGHDVMGHGAFEHEDEGRLPSRLAEGALRGAVGAMAMTGLREMTRNVGLLEEPPPEAIVRQKLRRGRRSVVRHGPRRAQVELLHWGYGAAAGAVYATLPARLRRHVWAGPAFGVLVWGGFEIALAPLLGLSQARRLRVLDRLALAADHLLYGLVLSESRRHAGRRAAAPPRLSRPSAPAPARESAPPARGCARGASDRAPS